MNDCVNKVRAFAHDRKTGLNDVEIDHNSILRLAHEFAGKDPVAPTWHDPEGIFPVDDLAFVCHEFYRSAVNACYADPVTPNKKFSVESGKFSGSMALGRCFYRRFGESQIEPEDILRLTDVPGELEKFFAGDGDPIPLLEERRVHLREAARVIRDRFDGDPLNIMAEAGYRVVPKSDGVSDGILELLFDCFPITFGRDRVLCLNADLIFAKRAQLWPCLYQGRALERGSALTPLVDPEHIGPILDYHVINVLRYHGCLRYSERLANHVDSKRPIERHSPEEIEMRAKAAAVVVKLVEIINALRPTGSKVYTGVEIDAALWLFGREAAKRHPYHLCLTMDY